MNYRALEDLVNILVKKAGYSLNEARTLEDADILTKRKSNLEDELNNLDKKINEEEYIDKEEKSRDLEEKKYYEDTFNIIKNQQEEGSITEKELLSLQEQIKALEAKIEIKDYKDIDKKDADTLILNTLKNELSQINEAIENKRLYPNELGAIILEAYRENKNLTDVQDELDSLVEKASNSYNKTVNEVKTSNIFELMDEYNNKKSKAYKKLDNNKYNNNEIKEDINNKCTYHSQKIDAFKDTIAAIEKREEELKVLLESSKELYISTLENRTNKESLLNKYSEKLYNLSNLNVYEEDFINYLDYLREEIETDKALEDKYNDDILTYKNEIRTLELNNKKVNSSIMEEEKCLEILNRKLDSLTNNYNDKIADKINYLTYSQRLESLSNEQQYYYVNVDVIKNEIINFWNKDRLEESSDLEITDENENSMYDDISISESEDILKYDEVADEEESIDLEPLEKSEEKDFELLDDFE